MKITGPGSIRPVTARPGRSSRAGGSGRFASQLGDEAAPARPGAAAPVGAVAAILAVQEVPEALDGRSRGLRRGRALLDQLEEIHLAILAGTLPPDRLVALRQTLAERRGAIDDPRLAAIIDEIELRATVELAKLGLVP